MPRLAYNGPPEGYNMDGSKKWDERMKAVLGYKVKLMVCPGGTFRDNYSTPEEILEQIKEEIRKIHKEFGYPEPKEV